MPKGTSKTSIWLGLMASANALVMGACLCVFILFVFSPSPLRHGLLVLAIVAAVVLAIVLPLRAPRLRWRLPWQWFRRRPQAKPITSRRTFWPRKKVKPAPLDRAPRPPAPAPDSVFVPIGPTRRSAEP